jgi:hypothetical protein
MIARDAYGALRTWHLCTCCNCPSDDAAGRLRGQRSFEHYLMSYGLSAIVYIAASLPVYLVLFLMWVHRTNRNAHVLAPSFDMSPAWGVGWFFVPIACLAKPFEGVEKTWNISTDPTRWRSRDTPTLLRVWWGLFLATNFVGLASSIAAKTETAGGLSAAAFLTIGTMATVVASSVASIMMVRQLTQRQVTALSTVAFD